MPRSEKGSKAKATAQTRMFKAFADKTSQGILVIKGEDILYVNASLARIIGYPLREVRNWQSQALLALVLKGERKEIEKLLQKGLRGRVRTRAFDVRITDKRGRVRWIQAIPRLIKIEGEPAILVTVTDVSEFKETEQALRASEERYRTFLEHFQGIAYCAVIGGTPVFFYGAVKAITGYSEKDLVSGRVLWKDIIHPDDWILIQPDWKRLGSVPGSACEREYRIIRKDGKIRWLLEFNHNISDESGQVFGVEGHIYDLTERKEAEEARHESETRYRTLVAISPDAIFLTDLTGRILIVNPRAVELYGCKSEAELLGRRAIDFVHPKDQQRITESLLKAIQEGRQTNIEYTLLRQDGTTILVDSSASVIIGADGEPQALIGIFRDITEQKLAERALSESEARYRALVEQSLQGIIVTQGTPLRIAFANTAFQEIIGYSLDELLALKENMDQLIYPDDRTLVLERAMKRLKGEPVPPSYEYRIIHKNGAVRWIMNYASVIEYEGQPAIQSAIADITDRKQAELALQESEDKYSNLFQYFHDAIFLHDLEGNILDVNQQVIDQLGYTREELLRMKISDLHPPEALEASLDAFEKITREGSVYFEIDFKRKNGEVFPAEVSSSLFNIGGQKVVQGIARDITERKRAEQELKEREMRYRALFENTSDAVFILSLDLVHLEVNQRAADLLGYTIEELVGMPVRDVVATREYPDSQRVIQALLSGKQVPVYERIFRNKDGTEFPVEINAALVTDAEGSPLHFQSVVRDITERKQAEQALRESENRFRSVAENMDDALIIREQGEAVYVNDRACEIFGYPREELMTKSTKDLCAPEERSRLQSFIEELRRKGGGFAELELRVIHKDGSSRFLHYRFSVRMEEGRAIHFVIANDITKRKLAEEAYRAVVEHSLQGYFILQDNLIVFTNPAGAQITGYTAEELLALSPEALRDLIYSEDQQMAWGRLRDRLAGKPVPDRYKVRFQRKDGAVRWVDFVGAVIEFHGLPAVQASVIDITEKMEAEEALRASETKYRSLVDKSLQGIVILQGTPPRIVFANPEGARMLGYSSEEILSLSSQDFENLLHPDDRTIILQRTREIIEEPQEVSSISYGPREARMFHKDQTLRWVELFARRVEFEEAPAVQTLALDITERKEAELALKTSEEKFRALVEELDDWVFEMDSKGCITYSNIAVENILGYTVGQMVGLNPFDFLHPDDAKETQQRFKELVAQKQPIRNLTARYLHRDGSIVILEAVGHPILDEEGKLLGYRGIYRDLTERLQILDQLRRYATE